MSDYQKSLDAVVSQQDWELMSKYTGVPAETLKDRIVPALEQSFQKER